MTGIKIVASDLDGTLLDGSAELGEENSRAMEEIVARGAIFLPITGRALSEIPECIKKHPAVRYIISSNGANLIDLSTGEAQCREIPAEVSRRVWEIMRRYPLLISPHVGGIGYVDPGQLIPEELHRFGISEYYINFFNRLSVVDPELDEKMRRGARAEMFAAFGEDAESLRACITELKELPGLHITSSTRGEIEVLPESAGKGAGLLRFAAMMGVDPSEIAVAGDNMNDVAMFRVAGLSVASPMALPEVRSQATYAMTEEDGGVADYILRRFM